MAYRSPALALLLTLWAGLAQPQPQPHEIVFIAPLDAAEPIARFENGQLVGGLRKTLSDALAQRLGRPARHVSLPSRRVPQALHEGPYDMLCYVMPEWVPGPLRWTLPIVPNASVLAASAHAAPLQGPRQLRGQLVGSVVGYHHPELQAQIDFELRRDDAPSMRANLEKLARGRLDYALTDRLSLQHFQRQNPGAGLVEALELWRYSAPCALSARSSLKLDDVNAALRTLQQDGTLARLFSF